MGCTEGVLIKDSFCSSHPYVAVKGLKKWETELMCSLKNKSTQRLKALFSSNFFFLLHNCHISSYFTLFYQRPQLTRDLSKCQNGEKLYFQATIFPLEYFNWFKTTQTNPQISTQNWCNSPTLFHLHRSKNLNQNKTALPLVTSDKWQIFATNSCSMDNMQNKIFGSEETWYKTKTGKKLFQTNPWRWTTFTCW